MLNKTGIRKASVLAKKAAKVQSAKTKKIKSKIQRKRRQKNKIEIMKSQLEPDTTIYIRDFFNENRSFSDTSTLGSYLFKFKDNIQKIQIYPFHEKRRLFFSNKKLSKKRANTVFNFIKKRKVSKNKMIIEKSSRLNDSILPLEKIKLIFYLKHDKL